MVANNLHASVIRVASLFACCTKWQAYLQCLLVYTYQHDAGHSWDSMHAEVLVLFLRCSVHRLRPDVCGCRHRADALQSMLAACRPLGHLQQQSRHLTEQQRRDKLRAQMAARNASAIILRSDPPGNTGGTAVALIGWHHNMCLRNCRDSSAVPVKQQLSCESS